MRKLKFKRLLTLLLATATMKARKAVSNGLPGFFGSLAGLDIGQPMRVMTKLSTVMVPCIQAGNVRVCHPSR